VFVVVGKMLSGFNILVIVLFLLTLFHAQVEGIVGSYGESKSLKSVIGTLKMQEARLERCMTYQT